MAQMADLLLARDVTVGAAGVLDILLRPFTSQIDRGSSPSGRQTLTAKITASRRGLSSSTASIGVFE